MNKIKKILACVDFSDYSLMTLDCALEVAKGVHGHVIAFNVINQRDLDGVAKVVDYLPYREIDQAGSSQDKDAIENSSNYLPYRVIDPDYVNALKKERQEKIKTMIKENFSDEESMISISIDAGVPFECILDAVQTQDVDLIVMANKGRGNISRVLFGSSAEKVFRHSSVPVLSVRDRMKFKRKR